MYVRWCEFRDGRRYSSIEIFSIYGMYCITSKISILITLSLVSMHKTALPAVHINELFPIYLSPSSNTHCRTAHACHIPHRINQIRQSLVDIRVCASHLIYAQKNIRVDIGVRVCFGNMVPRRMIAILYTNTPSSHKQKLFLG